MSKRRKKPATGYRGGPPAKSASATTEQAPPQRAEVPGFLGWLSRPAGETAWPTIPRALGRGFVTVGSSPVLLLSGFVLLLALWAGLVMLGLAGPPGRLVNLLALPPVSTYFDALNGSTIYGFGPQGFIAATAFLVARSVVLALLVGLTVQELEGWGSTAEGLRRGVGAIPATILVNLLTFSMMVVGSVILPALGPGLGFLASVLTLVAALFLFVFAPIAAVLEPDRPFFEAIRRGARAALLPGSRHLVMCLVYIFLALPTLVALAPGGSWLGVNPSLATWVYALFCTFLHLSFLAGFAYRFMAIEHEIPDVPVKLRRR